MITALLLNEFWTGFVAGVVIVVVLLLIAINRGLEDLDK